MSEQNTLRFAGDVNLVNLQIIGAKGQLLDIKNLAIEVHIYEDIFSPFVTGKIILQDSLDLINFFPFVGQEFVRVNARTPAFNDKNKIIDETFYLYKMSNREQVGDKAVMYELHFVSPEAIYDMNLRYSKAFEGTGSEVVQKIFNTAFVTQKKLAVVEPTTNKNKFIACNWSPIRTINYVTKTSSNTSRSNYLFFENRYGFNFTTINNLYQAPPYQNFQLIAITRVIDPQTGRSVRNPDLDYTKIIDFEMPFGFDYIDRTQSGMFASKIITHDYITKKYSTKTYSVVEEFPNHPHLNKYPVFTNNVARNSGALILAEPKHYGIHNGYGDISNTKNALSRLSLTKMAQAFRFNITVAGRTDYTAGQVVNVKMPTFEPHTDPNNPDVYDKMFSGNYLISALSHVIKTDRHETHMELIKDSLIFNLDA
jgi:hypothetical protein